MVPFNETARTSYKINALNSVELKAAKTAKEGCKARLQSKASKLELV